MLLMLRKLTVVTLPDNVCRLLGLPLETRVRRSRRLVNLLKQCLQNNAEALMDILEEVNHLKIFWPTAFNRKNDFGMRWANLNAAMNYFRIAHHFAKLNILSAAADAYEKGLDLYPFFVPVRLELAKVKQKLSEHHVACRVLEEGVQCNPDVPAIWTHLAALQLHLGLSRRAEASFANALSLYDKASMQNIGVKGDQLGQLAAMFSKFRRQVEGKKFPGLHLISAP